MSMTVVVIVVVLLLSWSNGSNDNFKGVSTIYGSGAASYRRALGWATAMQLAGSLLALVLAAGLVKGFSAKGLVPESIASAPSFLAAAALGGAGTVLLATALGLPVSTTHGLTGALVGAGFAAGAGVHLGVLGRAFVLPLLLSPVLAAALSAVLYPLAGIARRRLGLVPTSCVCVDDERAPVAVVAGGGLSRAVGPAVRLAITTGAQCPAHGGRLVGLTAGRTLEAAHFLSAGAVCFARGLNDTPKIAGLLLGAKALAPALGLPLIAFAMAAGGLIGARRVAETMSKRISSINAEQGFIASLTTAALVIAASLFSLPVSTTHVATGGIFGIGVATRTTRWRTVLTILAAWVTTLPLGAALGALAFIALGGAR